MDRETGDRNILDKFAEDFCRVVDKYAKYIVVSGFVAIAHGRSRGTVDIDMIIERISLDKFKKMHENLVREGFECLQSSIIEDIYDYLINGDSVRYIRQGEYLPPEMDMKFAKDELDLLQLANRKKFPFTGLGIWFSDIETNIAFKEELLKSDKDMEDSRHLRIIYMDEINEEYIKEIKKMIKRLRLKEKNERQGSY